MTTTQRTDPPSTAGEAETLRGYLDYHRDTLRMKTEGLDQEQLNQALAPSTMTLGGILKHLALVEDWWFSCVLLDVEEAEYWRQADWEADDDWEWHTACDDTPEQLRALYDDSVRASDEILDRLLTEGDLDTVAKRRSKRTGQEFSLRWIIIHMIEEYARHNGHADLIRESVDGQTGE